ncbi:hypothetical protein ACL02T_23075 [Pseudonocardia sp. RS010]|uniref:hypothetical protein n=1 Tax=Pseudonocardia sp. RS010 TaxID=3385979 RepID=UPI0039A1C489
MGRSADGREPAYGGTESVVDRPARGPVRAGHEVLLAALVARAAGVPLRMAAKLREPAEREYFDTQVKPLLCSDVEFLGELGCRRAAGRSGRRTTARRWS